MNENLANWYSYESTQRELSNEYQHDIDAFQKTLCPCALEESSLSIGRVKGCKEVAYSSIINYWLVITLPCYCGKR